MWQLKLIIVNVRKVSCSTQLNIKHVHLNMSLNCNIGLLEPTPPILDIQSIHKFVLITCCTLLNHGVIQC